MTSILFFHAFLLGVAISDWVEIKVVDQNAERSELPKTLMSTPPSYEDILVRPQHFYEISATTPTQENITLHSQEFGEVTFYKNNENSTRESMSTKDIFRSSLDNNISKTEKYPKEIRTNQSFVDRGDIDYENSEESYDSKTNSKKEFLGNDSSRFSSILKRVQNHLLNYKDKTLKGKILLLKDLRDNLLYQIKTRMAKLWLPPIENGRASPRGYKDYYPDDHFHMDFPSNEGALMTIGFLTFAVFLIKLVLKLIYTLKNKQQYFQATTTPASVFLKRNEREITQDQLEQSAKIMQYIEEYPLS